MRRRFATAAVVLAISSAAILAVSASASASTGGVYLVTPTWWGWCPGSSVTAVHYVNQTTGATGGDSGDDIAWASVNLNQTNYLTVWVTCRATWESSATYTNIRPTRSGQAWYIGADSNTWHN